MSAASSSAARPRRRRGRRRGAAGGGCRHRRGRRSRRGWRARGRAIDFAQRLAEAGPRHDTVLDDVVRRQPADGGEGALAPLPDQRPLRRVRGGPHLAGPESRSRASTAAPRARPASAPLQLDDQERLAARVAGLHGGLRRLHRERVHDLHRDRQRPAPTIAATASPARSSESKRASAVRVASGTGTSRSVTSTAMPKRPSQPQNMPVQSGPTCSVERRRARPPRHRGGRRAGRGRGSRSSRASGSGRRRS